jgi:DNA-binding Xre family transcriptional regulator
MAVINKLFDFWKQKEIEQGRTIPVKEVALATGVSRDTLTRLRNKTTTRFDENVIDKLCKFFDVQPGPIPFIIYQPEGKFFEWLKTQTERDDPIGDFAGDTIRKPRERGTLLPIASDKLPEWQEYMIGLFLIDRVVLDAFYDAWEEWSGEVVVRSYPEED